MSDLEQIDKLVRRLKDRGHKITEQRRGIIRTLVKYSDSHFTVEELYQKVKELNSNIALTTIYRNLDLLEEMNIVNKINFGEGEAHYELEKPGGPHHHIICNNCGKIIEFSSEFLEEFENDLEDKYNFLVRDHYIKFYGCCQGCWDKKMEV